ncbi:MULTISPECIES: RNA polymerase sigma factor [Olivibacter]|jgi:RNA polymerase sigma-70 factor (ECF subfamily)|uniref:RNA polymerase sigma factor n=1 Tax=Olivibacter oleidegradans TaxID=760123 RepID=A0ABV6HGP6_9SPHI|nr:MULTISPECIES: RNA polymerase sigma-70 factor [Olivibacter]QEL00507.1 RNA polymerase sigma-70 factor [Olivibacter sp. LS-1]
MPVPPIIDPLTIRKLRDGNEQAFQLIYQQCHQSVFRFAYAFLKDIELSKEVTQETFLNLWIHRNDLSDELPLYPYIFAKARNLTIDAFRRSTVVVRMQEEATKFSIHLSTETEDTILLNDLRQITQQALDRLPKQQKLVFELSRTEGLSYEEIASELRISKNTVKYHLVCALKNLRLYLAQHDIFYSVLIVYLLWRK